MLDAETAKVDYVSPNIERLLGIPWKEARQDARVLAALHPKDSPDRDKNYLEGFSAGSSANGMMSMRIWKPGSGAGSHRCHGQRCGGRTKHILVMSDRTADKQVNQRFPMPLLPPRPQTAPRAPSFPICPTISAPP